MEREDPSSDDAFFSCFVEHERALKGYARVLLPDWEAVEEVYQRTSLVMWQKRDQLQSLDGFFFWARAILRIEALRYRRSLSRERLVFDEDLLNLLIAEEEEMPVTEKPAMAALERCLEKLGVPEREVVLAPHRGRGSVLRLAERSGRTPNSLYKQIGRLRASLARCVRRQLSANPTVL